MVIPPNAETIINNGSSLSLRIDITLFIDLESDEQIVYDFLKKEGKTLLNLELKGVVRPLPGKEFELIYLLASKPEKVFKREKIMEKVWGGDVVVGDRTIDVHIRKLRE